MAKNPCIFPRITAKLKRPSSSQTFAFVYLLLSCLYTASSLNLSPAEKVFLGARLDSIIASTKSKFVSTNSISFINTLSNENNNTPRDIVVIFPGAGGPDQFTSELEQTIIEQDTSANLIGPAKRFIKVWDWTEHRGSILSAAFDGEAVGEAVAEAIHDQVPLSLCRSIHSIGISVGGFAANAFGRKCKALSAPYVRLTLLDPFCSRGILGNVYGAQNFGNNVDFAEHYLNTDDPVPTTNDPLPLCAVVDVTNAKEKSEFIPPKVS